MTCLIYRLVAKMMKDNQANYTWNRWIDQCCILSKQRN